MTLRAGAHKPPRVMKLWDHTPLNGTTTKLKTSKHAKLVYLGVIDQIWPDF